jgi:hypothetical protein
MNRHDWFEDEAEASQYAEQFAVSEGLAGRRESGPARRLLEQ